MTISRVTISGGLLKVITDEGEIERPLTPGASVLIDCDDEGSISAVTTVPPLGSGAGLETVA
jgi:hypothetical protein